MTTEGDKRTVVRYEVAKLIPHARQRLLFAEPTAAAIKELADDLRKNGQLQPVEILPDGVLIAGHKRRLAAQLLGWDQLDAWVREDLVAAGEAAVERRLIEDNLTRRQLDPLDLARCALRLKELASWRTGERLPDREKGELREQIGQRLNMSGRHVGRLLRVVEHAPMEVQVAVSAGRLSMGDAHAVAGLDKKVKEQIAAEIRAGGDPREVVRPFLGEKDCRHRLARDAKGAFVRALERGLADVEGRVQEMKWFTPQEAAILERAWIVIGAMRNQAKQSAKPIELADLVGDLGKRLGRPRRKRQ